MVDTSVRVAFLKKIHLFYGLGDDELASIADQLEEYAYGEESVIFEQNSRAESFYFIYVGSVKIVRRQEGKEIHLATLVPNDYFGEMALIEGRPHSGTATTLTDTLLFVLPQQNFDALLKEMPRLLANLKLDIQSRKLARSLRFRWLLPEEVIYFLARKHIVVLYQNLILPALALVVPAFFIYAYNAIAPVTIAMFAGVFSLVAIVLWVIWLVIDWTNDYYIVTNLRVVWLERVIAVYDSRRESPLNTIMAVAVETGLLGRALDYGDVIVRTYVGKIVFKNVSRPALAQRMIEEYWERTKVQAKDVEKEAMKEAIRRKLGLPTRPQPKVVAMPKADFPSERGIDRFFGWFGANRLRLRYERGDTVIYRKHWFVLFRQAWVPILATLGALGLFLYRLLQLVSLPDRFISFENGLTIDGWAGALFLAIFPFLLWLAYEILDWSNDIYEVTNDQIIDLDKKPFSTESRNTAQLENILAIEYKQDGILPQLFNYGTVYITVGGTQLAFENVIDPASVQTDIDRRRIVLSEKKKEAQLAAERERMAEWLVAYHQNAENFKEEQERRRNSE